MQTESTNQSHVPIFAGVDVGGTNIKVGIVNDQGAIICETSFATESERGPADAIQRISAQINSLFEDVSGANANYRLVSIGLGTPGTMDVKRGWILEPPNLPAWRHFPVRDELADESALPVYYTNDANAAAYGEFWKGRAKNESSVVFLTLGTGIGGGIVVGGQLLEGATGNPAELGHIAIQYGPDARVCSCGQIGHLEAYASATAVSKRAAELAESNPGGRLGKLLASQQSLTARDVYEAACKNDADAELVISETAQYLARGVAIVANTIDPGIVVLGGAMDFGGDSSDVGRRFIDRIVTLAKQTTLKPISENLKVEFAELGSAAGWIGAAGLAKRLYDRS